MQLEITGAWEDLVSRPEFRGHVVRVTVVDPPVERETSDEWLESLNRMARNGVRIERSADDSREIIYEESE